MHHSYLSYCAVQSCTSADLTQFVTISFSMHISSPGLAHYSYYSSLCDLTISCLALQLMDTLGQGSNGLGGPPGERPPNMLASIQSYLNRTQELMQNPTVLLPSLPDPPAPGTLLLPYLHKHGLRAEPPRTAQEYEASKGFHCSLDAL